MNIIVIYTQKVRGSNPLLPTSPKEAVLGTSITNIPITSNTTTATSNLLLNSGFENGISRSTNRLDGNAMECGGHIYMG